MKSIKFLLLSLALIAHSAHPMMGAAKAVAKYLIDTTGLTIANFPAIAGAAEYNLEANKKMIMECLNDDHETKPVIKDLLDTYADGKNAEIYFQPSFCWREDMYDEATYARALTLSLDNKMVFLNSPDNALKSSDHSSHYTMRGIVGHELGHVKNGNFFNLLGISGIFSTTIALDRFFNSKLLKRTPWILKPLLWGGAIVTKQITDKKIVFDLHKQDEYYADQNLIQCAKDPRDLRAVASHFRVITKPDYSHDSSDTHEHPLVHAERFEKAADDLEKRLAQPKSL